eukprot:CAMPEP_0205891792 /NCGR_PEP_ID=MMETSP1083-20121108/22297_1 /ASSEMBLY_ACC=CAM_ASM_000430 /TAXON_ID=97485 /ORGANISM="Prymnesium parvum, Strain Texoma1" /LENGTH=43 /DNA_ID= /DNA_START= /DNA_END= /DNA_ORIENTATION=
MTRSSQVRRGQKRKRNGSCLASPSSQLMLAVFSELATDIEVFG